MLNIALAIIIIFGLRSINSKKVKLSITFLVTTFALSGIYLGYKIFNSLLGSLIVFFVSYIVLVLFIKITSKSKLFLYFTFLISNMLAIVILLSDNFDILNSIVDLEIINRYSYIAVIMILSFAYCFVYYKKNYFGYDYKDSDKGMENKVRIKPNKIQNKKISI
jgi:hypothetical protein